jgi:hypothetical protein
MGYAAALTVILFGFVILLITVFQLRVLCAPRGVLTMATSPIRGGCPRFRSRERLVGAAPSAHVFLVDCAHLPAADTGRRGDGDPFVWMILTSFKPATELVEFAFLPKQPTLANYAEVLSDQQFWPLVFQQHLDRRHQHG